MSLGVRWRGVREKRRDMHAGFARQKPGDAAISDQFGDHLRRGYQFQKKLKHKADQSAGLKKGGTVWTSISRAIPTCRFV